MAQYDVQTHIKLLTLWVKLPPEERVIQLAEMQKVLDGKGYDSDGNKIKPNAQFRSIVKSLREWHEENGG